MLMLKFLIIAFAVRINKTILGVSHWDSFNIEVMTNPMDNMSNKGSEDFQTLKGFNHPSH
ncbi:MAG: hypothetical protein ACFFAU_08170 [Candidatus Hodarchaeota archaeon]